MKDALTLLDAIHIAYSRPEYTPKNGVTYCNVFVNEVCTLLGFKGFNGMLANQIAAELEKNPQWSEELNLAHCQDLANGGTLVLAAQTGNPHGHVNVVCPGKMKVSGRWGQVPSVANVGKENFIGRGLNWSFSVKPRMWIFRQTL